MESGPHYREDHMRQAFLFYSFMTIFVATAVVTLLGVTVEHPSLIRK